MQEEAKRRKGERGATADRKEGGRYGDATTYVSRHRTLLPPPPHNCLCTCLCAVRQGRTTAQYLPAYYPTTADARDVTTVAGHQTKGRHAPHALRKKLSPYSRGPYCTRARSGARVREHWGRDSAGSAEQRQARPPRPAPNREKRDVHQPGQQQVRSCSVILRRVRISVGLRGPGGKQFLSVGTDPSDSRFVWVFFQRALSKAVRSSCGRPALIEERGDVVGAIA